MDTFDPEKTQIPEENDRSESSYSQISKISGQVEMINDLKEF